THPRAAIVEHPYGALIEVSPGLRDALVDASRTIEASVWRAVRRVGLHAWLSGRAPSFAGSELCSPAIAAQVERLYFGPDGPARPRMPLILDVMLTTRGQHAALKVVELQSGLGYARIVVDQLRCLGEDPDAPSSWAGTRSPADVFARARDVLAGGGDVS